MLRCCLVLLGLTSLCLLPAPGFASSYPPGSVTQGFGVSDGTADLGDGSEIGHDGSTPAGVFGGLLRLTSRDATNMIGSFKLPDLDPGNVVRSFDLRFNVRMNRPAEGTPGEGWSINFGDIPADNGTGEGGFVPLPGGLSIAFDVRADEEEEGPCIEVFVGGVSVGRQARTFVFDTTARAVVIHWDSFGLDLSYDNRAVFVDLPTPGFSPGVGNRFAFTARTSTETMEVAIDNVKATTERLPVVETGGPVISEFVTTNDEFEDEFGDEPAWIEILNGSANTVDLTGWYLTDSKRNLNKWRIEGIVLSPYNYQVIFASGQDRQLSTNSFAHTSFTLSKNNGFVALVKPDGTIASSYEYGSQTLNVSYGEMGPERKQGYMYPATPGTVNTQEPALNGLAPEVQFSHPGGFVLGPVTLELTTSLPGAQIRYTLDRTEPGPSSPLYQEPLRITQFSTVRARAFAADHLPGPIQSATFVFMDGTLMNYNGSGKVFESNLPLIFLDSFGVGVDSSTGGSRPFRPTYAIIISTNPVSGRASLTNQPDYAGPAGTHVRGESSSGFPQRSYALEIWDEAGKDRDVSLLGMPAESDWVLYGPWSEKTLMRNKLVFDWMRALRGEDGTAVRTRFVELFFNQTRPSSGRVSYSTYRGVYVLMEKIKRTGDRVPLESLNEKTVDPELITGGYIIRKDKPDNLKNNWNTSRFGIDLQSFDPDRLNSAQLNYIRGYINSFETALNGPNARDVMTGYRAYIDPDTFIDAQWMLEIAKQVDGYVFSTYWHKDRGGRLRAGPLWDFNISLGNADYGTGDTPIGWYQNSSSGAGQLWYPRLHSDPEYKLAHWDRYWEMRRTIFESNAVMAAIDGNAMLLLNGYTGLVSNNAPSSIQNPVARHFRKWPYLGRRDWPNPPAETSIRTYQGEIAYLKNFLMTRLSWIDDQSLRSGRTVYRPPVLSHQDGAGPNAITVTIEPYRRSDPTLIFPEGTIYYTLDRSDPRLPGGGINPDARRYGGAIHADEPVTISARMLAGATWTPMVKATFAREVVPASSTNLVISEIMSAPAGPSSDEVAAGITEAGAFEFVEIMNIVRQAVDLSGIRGVEGIQFDLGGVPGPGRLLRPGESAVIVADQRAFSLRYPHVDPSRIVGQFRGSLDNGGETLGFVAADGSVLWRFRYDDDSPWPSNGDRSGRSIVMRDPRSNGDPANPFNWAVSVKPGGTPGESGVGGDRFEGETEKDSDGDGQPDLLEFACGSDPQNPYSLFAPAVALEGSEVVFQYREKPGREGIRVRAEMSHDLAVWKVIEPAAAGMTNRDGTVLQTVRAPLADICFYRLKVHEE